MSVRAYSTLAITLINTFVVACILCAFAPQSYAQTITARSGEHDSYSRLVFDGAATQGYEVRTISDSEIGIRFKTAAQLDMRFLDVASLSQVSLVQELSQNPLDILIETPAGRSHKHFKAGNRLVLDVLKPASGTSPSAAKPTPKAAGKSPKPAKAPTPATQSADTLPPVAVPAVEAEEPLAQPSKILRLDQANAKPNVVSISSVSPTAMAVFTLRDKVWMVNDQEDFILSPQITGPQAKDMRPLNTIENPTTKIFTFNHLKGAQYWTQGGGLVWRVLVGSDSIAPPSLKPIRPVRKDVVRGQPRSGTILWPFKNAGEIVTLTDPQTGLNIIVVTAATANDFAGEAYDFVDFKTLPSALGLAIMPKVDDLQVETTEEGVEISRSSAPLALLPQSDIKLEFATQAANANKLDAPNKSDDNAPHIFDFTDWQLGGTQSIRANETSILGRLPSLTASEQASGYLTLAKMYIASGMGAEATGLLRSALSILPDLESSADFKAIKGVALALNGRYADAFKMLSDPEIKDIHDVKFWRSFALAHLEDWQQAEDVLPAQFAALYDYPSEVAIPLSLALAETALRAGDLQRGAALFSIAESHQNNMRPHQKAALNYLKGEAARQNGNIDDTIKIWGELAEGEDVLYRVKAGLALTRLEVEERDLSLAKAVDRLERLRYSWRGDDLEAQLNYWLGRIYFDYEQYVKGLNIMRDAASFATGPHLGDSIIADMTAEFTDLFQSDKLDTLSAPDAAALYDRFSELIPSGPVGDQIAQRLARHLTKANLYDKSIELLSYQLQNRLEGEDAYRVAKRLAAIYLLDNQPAKALEVITKAENIQRTTPELNTSLEQAEDLTLLRARAMADNNNPQDALDLLLSSIATPKINRLRADIAWVNGFWEDAAEALGNVIEDQSDNQPATTATPSDAPANTDINEIIMQRAVALNLANDRIRLANMREKYAKSLEGTDKEKIFEVITRPRRAATLADRETLMSVVSEIDLFSDILNGFVDEP